MRTLGNILFYVGFFTILIFLSHIYRGLTTPYYFDSLNTLEEWGMIIFTVGPLVLGYYLRQKYEEN